MEVQVLEDQALEVQVLEDQIQDLQAEVAALQKQQEDNNMLMQLRGRNLQDALWLMCERKQEGVKEEEEEEVLSRLQEEVEKLEEDLQIQTQMNRISLDHCRTQTLETSSRQQQVLVVSMSGRCSDISFQLEFHLAEVKDDHRGTEKTISNIEVVVETSTTTSLSSFLSGVEESQDLLLFFRTLRTFSDRCDERRRTFQHFQDKYPAVVSLPGGCRSEVMTLNHPELPGCMFLLHWSVNVSSEGVSSADIDLLTKIPETALQLFPSQAVGGAAEAFHSLLRILGPEAAVESLIRAVSVTQE